MNPGRISAAMKLLLVTILLTLQLLIMFAAVHFLRQYSAFIYTMLEAACMVVIILLLNENGNQVYKFSWAMIVAIFSVSGLIMYFMWGRNNKSKKMRRDMAGVLERSARFAGAVGSAGASLEAQFPELRRLSRYLKNEGFESFSNTAATYYSSGEEKFEALFADLRRAERFIFLEYFIVYEGQIFKRLYDILKQKASEGVEVRFICDDAGSITNTGIFQKRFKQDGISYMTFNPMNKYVDKLYFNYRNHQKIAVIDGHIGYCGGVNIADEYANLYEKHGHWKDSAIRLEGDAVWGLTRIFLEMWEFSGGHVTQDYSLYKPQKSCVSGGFFQPFADGPTNNPRNPAEDMYCQIIAGAKEYVYITTPYLALDEVLMKTMALAAQSGVDIRLVTPMVFDHWYTDLVTSSFYEPLLRAGVRIFAYTPGFMHAKTIISDSSNAIVGSINLDYRSFYLHYECGVWLCDTGVIKDILSDYEEIFKVCRELSLNEWRKRPLIKKALEKLFRILAPVL